MTNLEKAALCDRLSFPPEDDRHITIDKLLREYAAILRADVMIPGAENMDDRFAWLEAKAIDMGYMLTPEPEHPDSPHDAGQ
jgi:hypothetical protein